jgi:protein SCO1/2
MALAGVLACGGCHSPRTGGAAANGPASVKHYMLRGQVISVDAADKTVTISHEAVPGFMGAMTMPYKVKDANVLTELHPGDRMTATLVDVDEREFYLDDFDITAQASPDYKPAVVYHTPAPGEALPDFSFLNQSGKRIHLAQFHGDVLLITFIYTRCPLSDYCPRMSRNFAQVDKALAANPAEYGRTHLLSISFDPEYDTPAVLRSYGGAYTGKFTRENFAHWDFAAPSPGNLLDVEKWFGIGVTPGDGPGQLTHSLCTVVVGPDGKIRNWYPTNEWTPEQLVADARKALVS